MKRTIAPALALLLLITILPPRPAAAQASSQAAQAPAGSQGSSSTGNGPAATGGSSSSPAGGSGSAPAGTAAPSRPVPPAQLSPVPAYGMPAPSSGAGKAPGAAAGSGGGPPIGIADEKFFTESVQAGVEGVEEFGVYDNPTELARVNRIGYELAQQADYTKYPITFGLVNMAEPNSMALPAGQIFVTRGMLDLGLDDNMLACVLGHEIGHVIKEHYLHRSRRAMLMNVLGNLLVAGVLISSARNPPHQGVEAPYDPRYGYDYGDGNRVQGAAAASLIIGELMIRSYSRDQEDEADQVGQQLAAAAGYDPDGARELWILMQDKAPQLREYGYLQTHPFAEERTRAAEARRGGWSIQKHTSAERFRQKTQDVLVAYAARQRVKDLINPKRRQPPQEGGSAKAEMLSPPKEAPSASQFVYDAALATWPKGAAADSIRLARLHKLRDQKAASCPDLAKLSAEPAGTSPPAGPTGRRGGRGGYGGGGGGGAGQGAGTQRVARIPGYQTGPCAPELHDFGTVVRAYRKELAEVQSLDPTGPMPPLTPVLNAEIADLETQRKALYPRSIEVFKGGVFETPFLVAFVSNFPEAPEVPQVALALGDAYSRTGVETEAVTEYLTAWNAAPDSAYGKRAQAGLRNLTGILKELSALQELVNQDRDPEMRKMAGERLASVAHSYEDVAIGAEYLRRFPDGEYVVPVLDRLNVLADNLYGEVVLYQGFGDVTKATERINKILTNAPLSPAAEKLRDRAMLVAEKNG